MSDVKRYHWGKDLNEVERDLYVLASDYDALAAELAEAKRALEVAHLAMADNGRMWEQCIDQRDALRALPHCANAYAREIISEALRGTERTAVQPTESLEEIAATQKWPHDPRCRCETCDPPSRER